ncbi:uncharacterized protein si:ch73-127m5.2 isoform X2 [Oncorhynchus keta]|nr:uncharacterized protein si:ch73-127m5.2 isoform X2 [Oncorhynchus keta]XP_035590419.1 uncharacterized protein si:ch73-127m5.2 isoform X2 [Oncorhynchus keta]XP_052334155.1 uncharacterized protein si:ch73-127m5.2 isoform X2 [Oncorhynchus keta]XP_052334156.1 uncharacterized protein si:ch73-127m5.2 isoform X2 [Oncorhynchus keta]
MTSEQMEPNPSLAGVDSQGNMVFRVVKPVMGIFQVSSEQTNSVGQGAYQQTMVEGLTGLQGLSNHPSMVLGDGQGQQGMGDVNQMQTQIQIPAGDTTQTQACAQGHNHVPHVPFAEVSSLLDPNMKSSKARKYLIPYDEIKRRLEAPEKMSLRSLAAYTRVSRGPASKKTLQESLNILGLTPSTTTAVSSSFSKLTEGDTKALCNDMKDFAHDYMDFGNMAKQLIPETNTVQHWSKVIETRSHLEAMRKCFRDPVNSALFDNVTHGLGLGMLDTALDMITMVIDKQIRILSGAAATDPVDTGPPMRRIRRRHRKPRDDGNDKPLRSVGGVKGQGKGSGKGKGRGRGRKKQLQESGTPVGVAMDTTQRQDQEHHQPEDVESSVLTLVSVGYETISSGLNATVQL